MKQWFSILLFTAMLSVPHVAFAAGDQPTPTRVSKESGEPEQPEKRRFQRFVDEDGDGLNDLVRDNDGDGIPNGHGIGNGGSHRYGSGAEWKQGAQGVRRGQGSGMGSSGSRGGGK